MKTSRQPIVTILGHVDHGKTSLLDALRKTRVAAGEAGGITQSIGASEITTKEGKKITFIDTPGHAAFSKMRSRGAKVADIAILVIAAEDGIKPQTQEAIDVIKDAAVPFIIAITKVDLPSADPEMVKGQLEKQEIYMEGRGGDTPVVEVSSKTGLGIDSLIETIILVSEVSQISADSEGPLEAVVIETSKEKGGFSVSFVVRDGKIKVSEIVSSEGINAKIRGLFNVQGKSVKEILPGEAGQALGFAELPVVGSQIVAGESQKVLQEKAKIAGSKDGFPIYLKAKVAGSLEALEASMPAGVSIIGSGVGDVNETDIFMAKAAEARIFLFESGVPASVKRLAETEGVGIERFQIIYELFLRLEDIIKKGIVQVLGKAQILASFPFNNKRVAGSKVLEGRINKADNLLLMRGEKEIGKVKIASLKKAKQEIMEAKAGEEFGAILDPHLDFEVGDVLVSVAK